MVAALLLASLAGLAPAHADPPAPGDDRVLIYGPSVTGGSASIEADEAADLGFTVDIVTGAQWAAMTAADFDDYRALIIGDPTCAGGHLGDAEANASVWGSVVDGNVVINGTDPVFHSFSGGETLTRKSVDFAVDEAGKTGLYVSLSCQYDGAAAGTVVDVLAGIGAFTIESAECHNDAHIVATHPAIAGLTDADLSNWSCSVHEHFNSWPADFQVLAIAERADGTYTAADGSVGFPYILARGEGLTPITDITLAPATDTNTVGDAHTVTATVVSGEPPAPVVGTTVTFTVLTGPHAGTSGTGTTDASGQATFTYTGTAAGTDTIRASFVDASGVTQSSNIVEKVWEGAPAVDESVTGAKYYDADADGQRDPGEPGIEDWVIDVNDGSATTSVATDADGNFSLEVEPGAFTVAEQQAAGWVQTGNSVDQSGGTGDVALNADMTYSVDLGAGETATGLNFGNLCIGEGGARSKGFWGAKNGKALFATDSAGALAELVVLHLVNEDGSAFDPASWDKLERWLKGARSVNQAYMLSAQLAAMALNVHFGLVDPGALILAEGAPSANTAGFATVEDVMNDAETALAADGSTPAGDPNRALQATLSDILDAANNNRAFVQAGPGDCPTPEFPLLFEDDFDAENAGAGALSYTGFAEWDVTDGTVDLIGNGFFDFLAGQGQGLYVDLDGSTNDAGVLTTEDTFVLLPGTYQLSFKLAGSQRGTAETVEVSLGSAFSGTYTRASADPLATVTETIVVTATTSAQLVFENLGGDNVGALLDDVRLERL